LKRVYLDHNATTPVRPEALEAALPFLSDRHGNPSSAALEGSRAREAVEEGREKLAGLLHARPEEIVFTSGGTESDNLALRGAIEAGTARGAHLVITAVEHPAVRETALHAERIGARLMVLRVAADGTMSPAQVEEAIAPDTVLVSAMLANNETGVLFPVETIGALCRERGVLFHTDAVQAVGKMPIDLGSLPIDLLSLSGHKMGAFQGTGALYVHRGVALTRQIDGGSQERRRRAGTENVPGIVSLGEAARLAAHDLEKHPGEIAALCGRLWEGIRRAIPDARLNGHPVRRLPNTLSITFPGAPGESLLVALDLEGIAVSAGSACASGSVELSPVLRAMGLDDAAARSTIRFSLGWSTTPADVDRTLDVLPGVVARVRSGAATVSAA
jgi:cysteine desulfurase